MFSKNLKKVWFDNITPHWIYLGSTGSGKSVYINSLIITLLLRNSPDELKMLIIDPKEVDFARYNGIPHLLGPVIASQYACSVIPLILNTLFSLSTAERTAFENLNGEAVEAITTGVLSPVVFM